MSTLNDGGIQSSSEAGVAGQHVPVGPIQFLVAPSTDGQSQNMGRMALIAIACWRVDDIRFSFDSSFVLPESRDEMALLAGLISEHSEPSPGGTPPPVSIFGHADPVGEDEYNKLLSGRRAAVIYGMLTRRDEVWEDLYSNTGIFSEPVAGDKWGTTSIQIMLSELVQPIDIDGVNGPETAGALKQFQSDKGLASDGEAGPATRKQLFLAYMDTVCVDPSGQPFQVAKEAGFLAQNQDASGKGDFQGCGEFNPLLIFSDQKTAAFQQAGDDDERDAANAPNRRVLALLFRPGSVIDPAQWPCPRAKEATEGCRKRFWSDGESRRSTTLPDVDRKYEAGQHTFACRFYERMVSGSPCEGILPIWSIRLFDSSAVFMARVPYRLSIGSDVRDGKTDSQGWLRERSIQVPADAILEWGVDPDVPESKIPLYRMEIQIDFEKGSSDVQDQTRLHNLGYDADCDFEDAVGHFQRDYGLPVTRQLDAETSRQIGVAHDKCVPRRKPAAPPPAPVPQLLGEA